MSELRERIRNRQIIWDETERLADEVAALKDALKELLEAGTARTDERDKIVGYDETGHPLSRLGMARHKARKALSKEELINE